MVLLQSVSLHCQFLLTQTWTKPIHNKNDSNKPVGFYGPIVPPIQNARSSECPRASIAAWRRDAGSITISQRASCCCSNASAGIAIGEKFQNVSPLSVLFESSREFFWNFQKRHRTVPLRPIWTSMVAAKLDQSIGSLWPRFVKIG